MIKMFLKWFMFALVIVFIAWLVPGVSVDSFPNAMLVCVVIALINVFIRPLVEFISLPVTFLTLGLFSFVINALLFLLAGILTPGFGVKGFLSALLGSVILSLFASFINKIN
ncbi:MAG: phage holin family protein [Cyanobacteria bacterium SIG30]|nr:phage holin family protein [Cyanobacteria bacterium SIG30]